MLKGHRCLVLCLQTIRILYSFEFETDLINPCQLGKSSQLGCELERDEIVITRFVRLYEQIIHELHELANEGYLI